MEFRATTPIKHDAIVYEEGEVLSLSSDQAEQLLSLGAIVPIGTPFKEKVSPVVEVKS